MSYSKNPVKGNPKGYLYLSGDGKTIGSKRISVNPDTNTPCVDELIAEDIWKPVSLQGAENIDINERTGFVNQTDSALSINEGTRTLSITPTGASFRIYSKNVLYDYTSSQSTAWPDTEGNHYFYFDENGDIQKTMTFDVRFVLGPWVFISYLYWDATNKKTIFNDCFDERHGAQMDGASHFYLHTTVGMAWAGGLKLVDFVADGDGSLDTHAQFGNESGDIADEDIAQSVSAISSTVGFPILYLEGAFANNRSTINPGFGVLTNGSGRLVYNEWTGSVWQLTEVANTKFVLYHIFATTSNTDGNRIFTVPGHNEYSTLATAQDGAESEILSVLPDLLLFKEIKALGTIIYQTGSYANAVKSRIRTTSDGKDYIDWRVIKLFPVS
jgi:hypothetical protein